MKTINKPFEMNKLFFQMRAEILRFPRGLKGITPKAALIVAIFSGIFITQGFKKDKLSHPNKKAVFDSSAYIVFKASMQKLWSDHMQYTNLTVNAFFHNQDALQPTLDRLLQNQKDLGAAIVPYYGQAAGDKLADLLTIHIKDAVPVLKAAQAGDNAALQKALSDWYANAKEIADFLSAANPKNWPESATEPMMKMHITQTTTYSVDLLKGNYEKAIKDYDKAYDHMMMMSDILTEGIAKQFPGKF